MAADAAARERRWAELGLSHDARPDREGPDREGDVA
jgi:hypothetical protein